MKDLTDPRTLRRIDRIEAILRALTWEYDPDRFGVGSGCYVCRVCNQPQHDERGRPVGHRDSCEIMKAGLP